MRQGDTERDATITITVKEPGTVPDAAIVIAAPDRPAVFSYGTDSHLTTTSRIPEIPPPRLG